MASIVRPSMLRQSCWKAASKRAFSTKQSSFPAINRPSASLSLKQNVLPASIAAFHTSGRRPILPPMPQSIKGTANDPAPVPDPSPTHGSYHWTFERLISAGLVPLTLAPFAAGSVHPLTDAALCAAILIHSHIGFEAIIVDYIPRKRLPKTKKAFDWGLKLATVVVGIGLYEFETNDVGLTEAIKRVWKA